MNNLHIFENDKKLCKAAASFIAALSEKSISEKGKFSIAFSGGNTPKQLYELMALQPYAASMDWKNIFIFWGDERYVPFTDINNNSHMAFEALLSKVPLPPENIFRIPVNLAPGKAAEDYEQTLRNFFGEKLPVFDLILLGLGDNGHTASLFPHTAILNENKRLVKEVFIDELNVYRISFTAGLINNGEHILFLVTGKAKADIIGIIFSGIHDPQKYPVQLINFEKENCQWFLDKDAASGLTTKM